MRSLLLTVVLVASVACTSTDTEELSELRQRVSELEDELAVTTSTSVSTTTTSTTSTTAPSATTTTPVETLYVSIRLSGVALTEETKSHFPDINTSLELFIGAEDLGIYRCQGDSGFDDIRAGMQLRMRVA